MMSHVMLDLETLGTRPGCVILSIGAVEFDYLRGTGREFYITINQRSSERLGLTIDKGTLAWWFRQSEDAKAVLTETRKGGSDVASALNQFTEFVSQCAPDFRVWGNSVSFDNTILAYAYHVAGQKLPWKFVNERCYRTLKNLLPSVTMERSGTYHNALDDARSQAQHTIQILTRLGQALKS